MPIVVEGPDGSEIEFPDDTAPEKIKDVMRRKYGGAASKADRQAELEQQVADEAAAPPKKKGLVDQIMGGVAKGADDFTRGLGRLPGAAVQLGKDFGHGAERIATGDVSPQEAYEAFVETPARSVPGADLVAAGAGNIVNFLEGDENNPNLVDENRARGAELREKYPGSALATELASAAAVGSRLAKVPGLAITQTGAKGNIAKAALQGALGSGGVELAETGDPTQAAGAALTGAVANPVLGGAVKKLTDATKSLAPTVRRAVEIATRQSARTAKVEPGMRKLAEVLKIKPAELEAKRLQIKQLTGRNASVAELADPDTIRRLQPIVESQDIVGKAAIDARRAAEEVRPQTLRAAVEKGGPTGSVDEIRAAQKKLFDDTLKTHGNREVNFRAPDFLNKRVVMQTIRDIAENSEPAARQVLDDFRTAVASGKPGKIRLRDLENVRVALSEKIKASPELTEVLRPVSDRLKAIAGNQITEYGAALKQYGVLGDFAEGAAAGRAAKGGSATEFKSVNQRATGTGRKGQEIGLRTAIADDVGDSFGRSTRAAEQLQSPGLKDRVATGMGPAEADRLATVGKLEGEAGRNLETLDPTPQRAPATAQDNLGTGLEGVVAIAGSAGAGFKVNVVNSLVKRFKSLGMSAKAAQGLSDGLFDASRAEDAIRILRKLGIENDVRAQIASQLGTIASAAAPAAGDGP